MKQSVVFNGKNNKELGFQKRFSVNSLKYLDVYLLVFDVILKFIFVIYLYCF